MSDLTHVPSMQVDNWNDIPSVWRNVSFPKPIKKSPSTDLDYLKNIFGKIVETNYEERPALTGVYVDESNRVVGEDSEKVYMNDSCNIVATNGNILLSIPNVSVNSDERGKIINIGKSTKDKYISATYPKYREILPNLTDWNSPIEINLKKLYQYNEVSQYYANKIHHSTGVRINKERYYYNSELFNKLIESMLKLGIEKAYVFHSLPTRFLILSTSKTPSVNNDVVGFLMPLRNEERLGSFEIDYGYEMTCYFDFDKNSVVNENGEEVMFLTEYPYNGVDVPLNVINSLDGVLIQSSKKNPYLEFLYAKDGYLYGMGSYKLVSESYPFRLRANVEDGIYTIHEKALIKSNSSDYSSHEFKKKEFDEWNAKLHNPISFELSFSGNTVKRIIDCTSDFLIDDGFRTVFSCLNFEQLNTSVGESESYRYLVNATDAHKLVKLNITKGVMGYKPSEMSLNETTNYSGFNVLGFHYKEAVSKLLHSLSDNESVFMNFGVIKERFMPNDVATFYKADTSTKFTSDYFEVFLNNYYNNNRFVNLEGVYSYDYDHSLIITDEAVSKIKGLKETDVILEENGSISLQNLKNNSLVSIENAWRMELLSDTYYGNTKDFPSMLFMPRNNTYGAKLVLGSEILTDIFDNSVKNSDNNYVFWVNSELKNVVVPKSSMLFYAEPFVRETSTPKKVLDKSKSEQRKKSMIEQQEMAILNIEAKIDSVCEDLKRNNKIEFTEPKFNLPSSKEYPKIRKYLDAFFKSSKPSDYHLSKGNEYSVNIDGEKYRYVTYNFMYNTPQKWFVSLYLDALKEAESKGLLFERDKFNVDRFNVTWVRPSYRSDPQNLFSVKVLEVLDSDTGKFEDGGTINGEKFESNHFLMNTTGISWFDELISDPHYYAIKKNVKGHVEMMSPEDYLRKVWYGQHPSKKKFDVEEYISNLNEQGLATTENVQSLIDKMNNGVKLNMPFLEYAENGKYRGQEGRNRSIASHKLGIEKIPVLIVKHMNKSDLNAYYSEMRTNAIDYVKSNGLVLNEDSILEYYSNVLPSHVFKDVKHGYPESLKVELVTKALI